MFFTEMEFRQLAHPTSIGVCPRCGGHVERCDLGVRPAIDPPPPQARIQLDAGSWCAAPAALRVARGLADEGFRWVDDTGVHGIARAGMMDRHCGTTDA